MSKKKKPPVPGKLRSGTAARSSSSKDQRFLSFVVFAFAFLLYANTLNHGYVLDDDVVYLKNKDVQAGTSGIKSILNHSFIYGFTGHNDQSYRPVVLILFAIEKQFFGNNPHTGHFINVLLFGLACVLFYRLMLRLFEKHPAPLLFKQNFLPLAITLLFAAHPIHTEAVANIKGRDDILNFVFFMLTLLFVFRHTDTGKKRHFIFAIIFFFLSLLCKEMAVTFLASIPLAVFMFANVNWKKVLVNTIPFAAVFILYMLIRNSVLDTVTFEEKMKVVNNALAAANNTSDRIATAILILGKYLTLLFFPHPLSWDYSYNQIPIVGFSDWRVIVTLVVFAALGGYALFSLLRLSRSSELKSQNTEMAAYAFSILFFFITMSVVSNLFILIGATLGERFLFVPSMAFCVAIPFLLNRFGKNILFGGIGVLLAFFSFKTFDRNKDWKDNISLFTSGVGATPNSSRAQSALGSCWRELGEKEPDPNKRMEYFRKAIPYYQKAIEILPDNTEALYNAGVAFYGIGDKENALKVYEQALAATPEYTNAANNAGVIYFERKDYEKAKSYFLQALKYAPNNSDALGNLGAINHNQGNMREAIQYYERALAINPGNQNVQGNLAKAREAIKGK